MKEKRVCHSMKKLLSLLCAAVLLFCCAPASAAEAQPLSDEASAWWNGLWYGWRVVSAAGGAYTEKKGLRYDVVGTIQTQDEHGVIVLWDYDTFAECCFLTAFGEFYFDESGFGRFYSSGGFAFEGGLEEKALNARPIWDFAHMLRLQGTCTDPDNAKNWFRYEIFLRPWGQDWEDVQAGPLEEPPYADMLPEHYEDWYLDQLAQGLDPLTETEYKQHNNLITNCNITFCSTYDPTKRVRIFEQTPGYPNSFQRYITFSKLQFFSLLSTVPTEFSTGICSIFGGNPGFYRRLFSEPYKKNDKMKTKSSSHKTQR